MNLSERARALCARNGFREWLRDRYGHTIDYAMTLYNCTILDAACAEKLLCLFTEAATLTEMDQVPVCIRKFLAIEEAFQKGGSK